MERSQETASESGAMIVNISSDAEADISEGYWFYEEQTKNNARHQCMLIQTRCRLDCLNALKPLAEIHNDIELYENSRGGLGLRFHLPVQFRHQLRRQFQACRQHGEVRLFVSGIHINR